MGQRCSCQHGAFPSQLLCDQIEPWQGCKAEFTTKVVRALRSTQSHTGSHQSPRSRGAECFRSGGYKHSSPSRPDPLQRCRRRNSLGLLERGSVGRVAPNQPCIANTPSAGRPCFRASQPIARKNAGPSIVSTTSTPQAPSVRGEPAELGLSLRPPSASN